jgi:glyoxylate reductase
MATILIAAEVRDLLDPDPVPGHSVEWLPAEAPVPKGEYAAIVPLLSRWIGGTELKHLKGLKIIANVAAGVDNVDLVAAELRGVIVTNTPDLTTEATADLTIALLLAVARRFKEGQQLIERGQWRGWHPTLLLGLGLEGRTLGIIGAGRIGQAVGRRARAFGMRLLYTSRTPKPDFELATGATGVGLKRLLAGSDIVSLHVPVTPETKGMMDATRLAAMQPGAILLNTARGELIREPALLDALKSGHLGGVGLDVFPAEPAVHPDLVAHPRAVVLPHIASATAETRRAMADLAIRNVRAVLAGDAPLTPVFR